MHPWVLALTYGREKLIRLFILCNLIPCPLLSLKRRERKRALLLAICCFNTDHSPSPQIPFPVISQGKEYSQVSKAGWPQGEIISQMWLLVQDPHPHPRAPSHSTCLLTTKLNFTYEIGGK
jgi:hypothetical protein